MVRSQPAAPKGEAYSQGLPKSLIEAARHALDTTMMDEALMEMANIPTKYTGLAPTIIVSSKATHDGKISQHSARIKVSNINGRFAHDDNFVMTVEHEPRVIGNCKPKGSQVTDIRDWVKLNHDHLINIWHNGLDMDPIDMVNGFQKL